MTIIGPGRTRKELEESAKHTREGRGRRRSLPGIKADASMNEAAHKRNRDLAERIGKTMLELKGTDQDGAPFVIGWRLYPNKEHPYWKDRLLEERRQHTCGCGCACTCTVEHPSAG
jgi:hypothetical protein